MNPENHAFLQLFHSLCKPGQDPTTLALTFDEAGDPTDPFVQHAADELVTQTARQYGLIITRHHWRRTDIDTTQQLTSLLAYSTGQHLFDTTKPQVLLQTITDVQATARTAGITEADLLLDQSSVNQLTQQVPTEIVTRQPKVQMNLVRVNHTGNTTAIVLKTRNDFVPIITKVLNRVVTSLSRWAIHPQATTTVYPSDHNPFITSIRLTVRTTNRQEHGLVMVDVANMVKSNLRTVLPSIILKDS